MQPKTKDDDSIAVLAQCLRDFDRQTGQLTRLVKSKTKTKAWLTGLEGNPIAQMYEWFTSLPVGATWDWLRGPGDGAARPLNDPKRIDWSKRS